MMEPRIMQIVEKGDRVFWILILLTPFILFPNMNLGWEVGKVYWLWIVVELWWGWKMVFGGWPKISRKEVLILMAWAVGWGVSAMIMGGNSIWGGWWRRQGWVTMMHLMMLSYLVRGEISDKWLKKLVTFMGIGVMILGFLGINENILRAVGPLGETNSWAMVSVVGGLAGLGMGWGWAAGFSGLVTLVSQSRSAMLALGVGMVRGRLFSKKWALLFLGMVIIFGWASWWRGGGERGKLWVETWELWKTSPWWGVGLDNFQTRFTEHMKGKGLEWVRYDQPHNLVLWVLVSTGSVGLGVFGGWIYWMVKKAKDETWLTIAKAIGVFGLFQPWSIGVWILFLVAMGRAGEKSNFSRFEFSWLRLVIGGVLISFSFREVVWPTFLGYF